MHENSKLLVFAIMFQMVQGLISLQEAGLVHKDLKPDNFMLEFPIGSILTPWDNFKVILIDLGLAKANNETFSVSGNNFYKSVDFDEKDIHRADNKENIDVYSLGAIIIDFVCFKGKANKHYSRFSAK